MELSLMACYGLVNCITFNVMNQKKTLCIQAAEYGGDYWFAEEIPNGCVRTVHDGAELFLPKWVTIA